MTDKPNEQRDFRREYARQMIGPWIEDMLAEIDRLRAIVKEQKETMDIRFDECMECSYRKGRE